MEQLSLFDHQNSTAPLASRLRPDTLEDFVGQEHLLGEGKLLRRIIDSDQIPSLIFWGPPGVGKTTLANIIARRTHASFINFSAVTSGIKEIKEVMAQAEQSRHMGQKTLLFVDEIHRFNKAQQDAFLPYVEKGSIILIGATTENPSFEINAALLSRCRVFVLKALEKEDLIRLLTHAIHSPNGYGGTDIQITPDQLSAIAAFCDGDARTALNMLEMAITNGEVGPGRITITDDCLNQCINRKSLLYDKNGEEHYNLISALHKSMRNTDPDAALYWLSRMLESGENPLYVARRLIRFASEDVGLADPNALTVAVNAYQASHFIGMPECTVNLSEAVVYLSLAPKSNALYTAYESCKQDVKNTQSAPVPLWIRNAPTRLMEDLHYGEGYIYAHDTAEGVARMQCLPDCLKDRVYYRPTQEGREGALKEKLDAVRAWKAGD